MSDIGHRVVVCRCAGTEHAPGKLYALATALLREVRVAFEDVADLCGLAAARDRRLAGWAASERLTVMACYPRAIRWLFAAGGAALPADARLVNLRTLDERRLGEIIGELAAVAGGKAAPAAECVQSSGAAWKPWFPVIDRDRCTNCMQCLSFCLFDVYATPAPGRVEVASPANCKTDCPACARLCPEAAIIFPKYHESPVNGDEPPAQSAAVGRAKIDVSSLLGGDVYAAIRSRGRPAGRRFSPRRSDAESRAIRRQRLRRKQAELGIPDEVVAMLAETMRMRM